MRRRDNKYGYSSFTEEELRKYLKWLTIPGVIILLVLAVILAKNLAGKDRTDTASSSALAELPSGENSADSEGDLAETGESQEENGEIKSQEESEETFAKDQVLEVGELINSYFTAKQNADVETVYRLFGRTDMEGAEALKSQYRYTSRYTDGYENIVCYTKPGPAEGSYLVYVSYDLRFKNVETLAPGLFRAYVITSEEGTLQLADSSLQGEEVLKEFEEAEKTDELILLRTEIYAQLRQALETDPDLAGVYGVLQKNPVVGEVQESKDSSVSIVSPEGVKEETEAIQIEIEGSSETETAASETETTGSEAEAEASETETAASETETAAAETQGE